MESLAVSTLTKNVSSLNSRKKGCTSRSAWRKDEEGEILSNVLDDMVRKMKYTVYDTPWGCGFVAIETYVQALFVRVVRANC